MATIKIVDVWHTLADEGFYLLNKPYDHAQDYPGDTLAQVCAQLSESGWYACGTVKKSDGSPADMFFDGKNYIALWQE